MNIKKKIAGKGGKLAAIGIVAGLLLGGAAVVKDDADYSSIAQPIPVVQVLAQAPAPDVTADDNGDEELQEEKKRSGLWTLISAPAYAAGWILSKLLSLLWRFALTPVMNKIVFWLLIALTAFAAIAAGLKAAFPDVPLREILTGKRCAGIIGSVFAACAVCALLSRIWPDYEKYAEILRAILGYASALLACFIIWRRRSIRKEKAQTL